MYYLEAQSKYKCFDSFAFFLYRTSVLD